MSTISGDAADPAGRLFVHGSLPPGRPDADVLDAVTGSWEPARVKGRLLGHGWGAATGFPALVPDEAGSDVEGFLLTSEHLREHWARLDELQGAAYRRSVIAVRTDDGSVVSAHVYVRAAL